MQWGQVQWSSAGAWPFSALKVEWKLSHRPSLADITGSTEHNAQPELGTVFDPPNSESARQPPTADPHSKALHAQGGADKNRRAQQQARATAAAGGSLHQAVRPSALEQGRGI
jgi:hypothetical protein